MAEDVSLMNKLKALLNMNSEAFDAAKVAINQIVANTQARLLLKLKGSVDSIPQELEFVVLEVAVKRFNRIKNEGMTAYSQEGQSISYSENDFAEFDDDIQQWLADNAEDTSDTNKLRFINPYKGGKL